MTTLTIEKEKTIKTTDKPKIIMIVAIDDENGIGKDNKLMWNIKEDLQHFKDTTTGKTVVMGRNTFNSIGRPLPNRNNIILSNKKEQIKCINCKIVNSIEEVLTEKEDLYIIGGQSIYEQFMPYADELIVTHVNGKYGADTFFPHIDLNAWRPTMMAMQNDLPFHITWYKRNY